MIVPIGAPSCSSTDEFNRLWELASPGPWTLGGFKVFSGVASPKCRPKPLLKMVEGGNPADLRLVACLRQDVPRMMQRIETLEQLLDEAKAAHTSWWLMLKYQLKSRVQNLLVTIGISRSR